MVSLDISYEDFKREFSPNIQSLVDNLRDFCLSLDKNVEEDIRVFSIVFYKNIVFSWFVDIKPQQDLIIITTRESKRSEQVIEIKSDEKLEEVKEKIKNAFNNFSFLI